MEGIDWEKPGPGDVALNPNVKPQVKPIAAVEGEAPHNASWSGIAHFFLPKEYRDSFVQATDIYKSTGYERRLYDATLLYQGKEPEGAVPALVDLGGSNADG